MITKLPEAIIFGAGYWGEKLLPTIKKNYDVKFFIDNSKEKQGCQILGYNILNPMAIRQEPNVTVFVCINNPAAIVKQLEEERIPNNIVVVDTRYASPNFIKLENFDYTVDALFNYEYDNYLEYHLPLSNWQRPDLYYAAIDIVLANKVRNKYSILEVGCGAGQFAKLLFDNGFDNYRGYDLSYKAIALAKKLNPGYEEKFYLQNIFEIGNVFNKIDIVIAFEVLEHMKNDLELFKKISSKTQFLFSVPNFPSFNHLRTFADKDAIYERYGAFLKIHSVFEFRYGKDIYFLVNSMRR